MSRETRRAISKGGKRSRFGKTQRKPLEDDNTTYNSIMNGKMGFSGALSKQHISTSEICIKTLH
jgi:hypothetical protein